MQTIVCPHCNENVQVPDDLTQAHCVRCGNKISRGESHVTEARPPIVEAAIQRDGDARTKPLAHNERQTAKRAYADWDDFRANSPAVQRCLMQIAMRPLPDIPQTDDVELPEDTAASVADFGEHLATLDRPGERVWLNVNGAILFAAAMIVLGLFAAIAYWKDAERQGKDKVEQVAGAIFIGACFGPMAAGAFWYAFLRKPALRTTFWVYQEGVLCRHGDRFSARRWIDVADFHVNMANGYPVYFLRVWKELDVSFSRRQGRAVEPVMEFVELQLASTRFLDDLHRVCGRKRLDYGDIQLDLAGLATPRFFANWDDIHGTPYNATHVFVDMVGQQSHKVLYRRVSFPIVALAIANVLREEHEQLAEMNE